MWSGFGVAFGSARDLTKPIVAQLGVDFGGPRLSVPAQLSNHEQRRAIGDREAGKAVPQIVDPDAEQGRNVIGVIARFVSALAPI